LLEAEKQSFDFAQKDLEQLSRMPLQPENFFSQDVTLVSELETLEKLGSQLNVRVELSGISGTVKNAAKAKTASDIVTIPYNISVRGSYPQIVNFLEYFENLPFVTTLTSLAIRSTGEGEVIMSGNALFYLKR
jgi:Tfp pilus assembly protein PilO